MFEQRVLVTGASGFIGSHLSARLLEAGHHVTCLYSERWKSKDLPQRERCSYAFADINDPVNVAKAVKDAQVVFHLAARTKNQQGMMMHVNRDGTRNLLEQCAALDHQPVFVMVSSLAATGPMKGGQPPVESDPCQPVSLYGRSKRAAEKICHQFADRLPISIVRPPIVFGPEDRNSFELFRPIAQYGMNVVPGYRNPSCSMVHSNDLVRALITVAENGKRITHQGTESDRSADGIYFVADPAILKSRELGRIIGQSVGRERVFHLHVPFWMIRIAGWAGELTGKLNGSLPFLNADKAIEITAGDWTCNPDAIYRDTQFRPKYNLRERIKQTANWYFENGWLTRRAERQHQYSHGDRKKVVDS